MVLKFTTYKKSKTYTLIKVIDLGHRSADYSYSHVAIPPTQASRWCPLWSPHRTAAAWRSSSTSSLWTSTRPSKNETSALTPAPCWTLSSDTKRQDHFDSVYLFKALTRVGGGLGRGGGANGTSKQTALQDTHGLVVQLGALA